ncbi:hypothetical protein [Sulfurospirillum oryzae]|uniref:hypothetical protein n=1 Tax=Sulfurospirillum oryzae TaxID=2976535 RepID=UPI0021E99972|nr:hypothetical protein [Sulfurospirillum oryzae]
MKKILNPFVWFRSIMKIFGYSRCILAVKNSTLEFDRSRTIGKVFNTYIYFEKILWKERVTHAGQKIVQVDGFIDIDFLSFDEVYKKILKSIKIIAHFNVSADRTVKLNYMGIETTNINGETIKYDIHEHEMMLCMQDIYDNKPIR